MSEAATNKQFHFFDCDNHFYEPPEAMLRYLPEEYKKVIRYANIDGRTKLVIEGRISEYIPNPTFEVVAAPGCHEEYYRGNNPEGKSLRELTVIERSTDVFFRRSDARYALLKEHGLRGALVFPTLASVIEGNMGHKPDFCHAVFHSLNQWIKDEWGFGEDKTFYATPVLTLMNVEQAIKDVEWIINQGARVVLIRPSYVPGYRGSRGMGSPEFAPVFSRLEEAGVFIGFHSSDNGYMEIYTRHSLGDSTEFQPFKQQDPLSMVMDVNSRACADHLASLVCHGTFERHPKLKVGYVETGVAWLFPLWERIEHVFKMQPQLFKRHPHETIREHVWFHPHFEENPDRLIDLVGADNVLFGSDWPHPEGLANPSKWLEVIAHRSEDEQRKIMGGNLMSLLGLAA